MQKIIYIQRYIYLYKANYIIKDKDLSKLFRINVKKIIKKYRELFDNYCFKINDDYLIKKDGIVLITMLDNSYYLIDITNIIIIAIECLEKINSNFLNKISIDNN